MTPRSTEPPPARGRPAARISAKLAGMDDRPSRTRPHRARCDACGDVIRSLHAWHTVTCSCGGLTLGGGPDLRRVHWRAEPGTSWTDLSDEPETDTDDADTDDADTDDADTGDASTGTEEDGAP